MVFSPLCHMQGAPRDGQIDERVLVRQPVCPTHRSAGQENRLTALCHQGNQNLSPCFVHRCRRTPLHKGLRTWLVGEGALWRTPLQAIFGANVLSRDCFLLLLGAWTLYEIIKREKSSFES